MSKESMLASIRAALTDVPETEIPADVKVPREYLRSVETSLEERLELFTERIEDYKVIVHRISEADIPKWIATSCEKQTAKNIVVPKDLPAEWLPFGFNFIKDTMLSHDELDQSDGVITGCAVAVAQTGSIALDAGKYQGRRAITLLPDYHLCVVYAEQIVDLVPEAFKKLESSVAAGRAITFISGPSATSDIELNRVEGVHGPRTLEVLLIA